MSPELNVVGRTKSGHYGCFTLHVPEPRTEPDYLIAVQECLARGLDYIQCCRTEDTTGESDIRAALLRLVKHLDGEIPTVVDVGEACIMCGVKSGPCEADCPTELARVALGLK